MDVDDGDGDFEESWTFIGNETDPEVQQRLQEWDSPARGRAPRVSMDRSGLKAMQGIEAVRKASVT